MSCGMELSHSVHKARYSSKEGVDNTAISCALPWFPLSWSPLQWWAVGKKSGEQEEGIFLLEPSGGDKLTGSYLGTPGPGLGVVEVPGFLLTPGMTARGCWFPKCHSPCPCLLLVGIRSVHSALGREDLHFHPVLRLVKNGCLEMSPERQTPALALGWVA